MIINGNSLEELKKFPDNYFHSVVTDPPYGLSFMGKKWDYDVPSVELWQEVFRVLKEGGYLLSFAGTRTQHRMAVNIEDAGFEIRDMIAWVYGSGFPKSHNIGKAIDKDNGKSISLYKFAKWFREVSKEKTSKEIDEYLGLKSNGATASHYRCVDGKQPRFPRLELYYKLQKWIGFDSTWDNIIIEAERDIIGKRNNGVGADSGSNCYVMNNGKSKLTKDIDITIPKTEEAKKWEGWGTALKPALEPITMARKPFKGTVANNVLKNGVGGINIDGCRVGNDTIKTRQVKTDKNMHHNYKSGAKSNGISTEHKGRFPANFIHDGSDEVKDLFPYTKSGQMNSVAKAKQYNTYSKMYERKVTNTASEGSASRFFYCAKASKQDRNEGCENLEEKKYSHDGRDKEIESPHQRNKSISNNHHPTVKPTDLMRYLVRLVTPKNGIVLDCFMGSGSTGKACALEGFEFVGIDLDKDYCKIAKARIDKALEDKKQADAQIKLF